MSGTNAAAPMILEAARFENFKCLADVTVPIPSRFTLIVGKNASGKSSVLDGIDIATQMLVPLENERQRRRGRAGVVFSEARRSRRLRSRGSDEDLRIGLHYADGRALSVTAGVEDTYEVAWTAAGQTESLAYWPQATSNSPEPLPIDAFVERLGAGRAVRLRLSARNAALASAAARRDPPALRSDGYGLATVLAWLAGNQPRTKAAIEEALASVVPGAGTITTPSAEVSAMRDEPIVIGADAFTHARRETVPGHTFCLDMPGAEAVPADLLSDGTVLALALLTVLHGPECPRVVLIDDIDAELHPAAQADLIVALRRILELKPDVQIIATTHSPYLLDSFEPGHVVVLSADPKTGHTSARLLSEHPRAASSKGMLRTGELWSAVGEDWASGGASAATK